MSRPAATKPIAAVFAAFTFTVWSAGCGDTVTIIECPPGTQPVGSQCVPIEAPDTVGDTSPDTASDTQVPDTAAPTDTTTTVDTTEPPPDVPVQRATGSTCVKNADCAGGTCLDWTGGYCTRLDCDESACDGGEVCLPYAGNHLCVRGCTSDSDCGSSDQACKRLPGPDGEGLVGACIGVDVGAGSTGARCDDATACAGDAACLAAFPGGYCAALGCTEHPCGFEASCVRVDGVPSCLLRCNGDAACGGEPGAERRCGVLQSTAGSPVDVCISGVEGKALGASCRSDFECSSGTCQVLGEGRCSQTGGPCFVASVDTDCNGAEFCQVTAESRVGICSQPCAVGGRSCPGAAHCVAEGFDPREAWCRPACSAPGDATCNTAAGLSCAYGIPISDSGQGRYACARTVGGSPRVSCNGNAACGDGRCLLDGNAGYCAARCGEDAHCPFGGSCVFGQTDECMRSCFSNVDCPSGFSCGNPSGASRSVCVP